MKYEIAAIWPNYNSMHIINTAKKSIKSLDNENKDEIKIHLIIVDNASTDKSYELITRFVRENTSLSYTIIRAKKNLGYAGAVRIAYDLIGKNFDYILLLNNDIIASKGSIKKLVTKLEQYELASIQGIILRKDGSVDNIGFLTDEFLLDHPVKFIPQNQKEPFYITYSSGSFSLIDNRILKKCINNKPIMFEFIPAYLDDNLLGIRLWNCNQKIGSVKVFVGYHLHSATYSRYPYMKVFNHILSYTAKTRIINTRLKPLLNIFIIKLALRDIIKNNIINPEAIGLFIKALTRGTHYGNLIRLSINGLDLYKCPYIPIRNSKIIYYILRTKFKQDKKKILKIIQYIKNKY